jgi:hypothetical protein
MASVARQQAELQPVLARARQVARFYKGQRVTSRMAIFVLIHQLDRVERQLEAARLTLNNGNGKKAS